MMGITTYPQSYLDALPLGAMIPWPHASTPAGFAAASAVLSRTAFAEAFAHFGTTWGDGDGSTTFSVPFSGSDVLPWNAPRGRIGYAVVTGNVSGVAGTLTDLTGATITFTAFANRRYKVTGYALLFATTNSAQGVLVIADGANTQLANSTTEAIPAAQLGGTTTTAFISPSAGSVTVKLRIVRQSGSGTLSTSIDSLRPDFISVEDIGADTTVAPYSTGKWLVKVTHVQPTLAGAAYEVCTSSTRPTGYEGKRIFETDTKREWIFSGSAYRLLPTMNPPHCLVARITAFSTTANTTHPVLFTSEITDTDTMHDNSSNNSRIVLPYVGRWQINFGLDVATGGTIDTSIGGWMGLNSAGAGTGVRYGFDERGRSNTVNARDMLQGTAVITTTAITDYIEAFVFVASANGTLGGVFLNLTDMWLEASYLGPVW